MSRAIAVGDRWIGSDHPALIVAELSANHLGSLERALEIVDLAHQVGADAIKLQTYTADTMTIDCDQPWFRIERGPWAGRQLYDLYTAAQTPWGWHAELFAAARRLGMLAFSTPFDVSAVHFLQALDPACFKVASFELTDLELLRAVARTARPVLLSTGMASSAEIDLAVNTLRDAGCRDLVLLVCVSAYPATAESFRLRNVTQLACRYEIPVGLSDHSAGHEVALVARALGASVIEKHLCRRRADGGPDATFSMEPDEFAQMVGAVRRAEAMLATARFGVQAAEQDSVVFRRSLFAVRDVAAGERFTVENVRAIRPGHGLPPSELPRVLTSRARLAIARGTPLREAWLEPVAGETAPIVFGAQRDLMLPAARILAAKHALVLVRRPEELDLELLERIRPRFVILPDWSWIVPTELLERAPFIGFHASSLPAYRGGSPLQYQILDGLRETELSMFRMQAGLDAGPVLLRRPLSLEGTIGEVWGRIVELVPSMVDALLTGTLQPQRQPQHGFVRRRRQPSDSELRDLSLPLDRLYDVVRALDDPYPNAFLRLSGKRIALRAPRRDGDALIAEAVITEDRDAEC